MSIHKQEKKSGVVYVVRLRTPDGGRYKRFFRRRSHIEACGLATSTFSGREGGIRTPGFSVPNAFCPSFAELV